MGLTLQYKGCAGSVEFNAEDRIFHGSLLGTSDAITYDGVDVHELEAKFQSAVERYLAISAKRKPTLD